jgi:hypothetical protein
VRRVAELGSLGRITEINKLKTHRGRLGYCAFSNYPLCGRGVLNGNS